MSQQSEADFRAHWGLDKPKPAPATQPPQQPEDVKLPLTAARKRTAYISDGAFKIAVANGTMPQPEYVNGQEVFSQIAVDEAMQALQIGRAHV